MVNYQEAIKRPFTDVKKLLIGILLNILPIVNFFAAGYQLECARTAMKKKFKLPEWENWSKLFVDGLLMIVIGFLYILPMFFLFIITIGRVIFNMIKEGVFIQYADNTEKGLEVIVSALAGMWLVVLIIALIFLVVMYLIPMAVIRFVESGKFRSAFEFSVVFKKAFNLQYFKVWIVVAMIMITINILTMWIPFVGGAIGNFISGVIGLTLFGEIYKKL